MAVARNVGKEQRVTLIRAEVQPDLGKACFAAFVAFVEVDEEGRDALAKIREVRPVCRIGRVEKVMMRLELLSDGIMEQLRRFKELHWQARRSGYPVPDDFRKDAHFPQPQGEKAVVTGGGADLLSRRPVENHGGLHPFTGECNQPAAFGGRGEAFNQPDARFVRERRLLARLDALLDRDLRAHVIPEVHRNRLGNLRVSCIVAQQQQLLLRGTRALLRGEREQRERLCPVLRAHHSDRFKERAALAGVRIAVC